MCPQSWVGRDVCVCVCEDVEIKSVHLLLCKKEVLTFAAVGVKHTKYLSRVNKFVWPVPTTVIFVLWDYFTMALNEEIG